MKLKLIHERVRSRFCQGVAAILLILSLAGMPRQNAGNAGEKARRTSLTLPPRPGWWQRKYLEGGGHEAIHHRNNGERRGHF